jgi:hypothetical protein
VLYDLEKDPFEMENLGGSTANRSLIAHFDAAIERAMRETGDQWNELQDAPYR